MTRGTAQDERPRGREAEARTTNGNAQTTAFRTIDSLADAIGAPGERSISQRLDSTERVLLALARAQGLAPDAPAAPV